jgi:GT2 family glycosyltransferase
MNQGPRHGKAPYVCFLNNDILVPPEWLSTLITVAESDASIGLVNPASNTFGIRPRLGTDWLSLANSRAPFNGRWAEVKYAEGFCILAKRETVEQVGGFDEATYKQIYFEDADLSRKIQALGLRCVMAEGTYVWHHEGHTMGKNPARLALFRENEQRFVARWGRGQRVLYALQGNGSQRLSELYEQARGEANRSGDVWIFTRDASQWKKLPRHLNIRVKEIQTPLLPWAALWKVLTKKKRFDLIRTDLPLVAQLLKATHFLHRGSVLES